MVFLIRLAQPLDSRKIGRIISEFSEMTDWMPNTYSVAENTSFAGKLIDYGWVRVFEHLEILGLIARNATEINALYVEGSAR